MSNPTTRQTATPAVRNEQLKLAATACNNLGVALVVTGVIAPTVALAYQVGTLPHGAYWPAFVLIWPTIGLLLHIVGQNFLKGLR